MGAVAVKTCHLCAEGGWNGKRPRRTTRMQAINYTTPVHINLRGDVLKEAQRVCWVCPICDSADVQ